MGTLSNPSMALSGNTLHVSYHLCIRHTLDTVLELHQSSENKHHYFHIIKKRNTYIGHHMQCKYYCLLVICVFSTTFVDV